MIYLLNLVGRRIQHLRYLLLGAAGAFLPLNLIYICSIYSFHYFVNFLTRLLLII